MYIPQFEVHIIDICNLNCKGCSHFSSLFTSPEVYPLETFCQELERLSQICDIQTFYLLGGEPLLVKNLDEYVTIARNYLPKTDLRIIINGLLIPSLPQKILDSIRDNNINVSISRYPLTSKMIDKIYAILDANKIYYKIFHEVRIFTVPVCLHGGNNPVKSRSNCGCDPCFLLRYGKIYKCAIEAMRYKFEERFGIENLPKPVGVDIYAPNFPLLLAMLYGNVEMCHWCSEQPRKIPWRPTNNPKLEDWLADPDELKKFL